MRKHPVLLTLLALVLLVGIQFGCALQAQPQANAQQQVPQVVSNISFAAIGDMGSGLPGQIKLANQMIKAYQEKPYTHVLMLGDNIYPDGDVKKYGKSRFSDPYKPLLDAGVQFKATLGNHDVLTTHTKENMAFFKMPAKYYDFINGPVHFFVLNTNSYTAVQQKWLEERLQTATEPYKIVYGHHPVFSSGMHGSSKDLQRTLKPLLEKYKVQAYLCGHDHDYERFAPVNGVLYIVSGGGGASLRPFSKVEKGSLVRQSTFEFLRFDLNQDKLGFKVVNAEGKTIDQGTLSPTF